ncbi:hemolysin XhlA family protein, partial [Bacillus thuringiensis]
SRKELLTRALFYGEKEEEWIPMEHCRECEEAKQDVQDIQVRLAVVESKVAKIEENIEKILSNTNWLVKSIVGGMIAALLAFLLKGGL